MQTRMEKYKELRDEIDNMPDDVVNGLKTTNQKVIESLADKINQSNISYEEFIKVHETLLGKPKKEDSEYDVIWKKRRRVYIVLIGIVSLIIVASIIMFVVYLGG